MATSVNFDPAARTYESTRGFPAGIGAVVAAAAADLIGPVARDKAVLEIGVGTGRIARPLAEHGVPVVGVDLSAGMLAELRRLTNPGARTPGLLRADATRLPFRSGSFAAVVGVHVFHLIPEWRVALSEVERVLIPGGRLLVGNDWRSDEAPSARLMSAWRDIVRAKGFRGGHPGATDHGAVKGYMTERGATYNETLVGDWTRTRTAAELLAGFEQRTWSSTWGVPDAEFATCLAELRAWALEAFGTLDAVQPVPHRFQWQQFVLP